MEISRIDHIELYVGDAQQSAFYFTTAFGFARCGQGGAAADQRSVLLRHGDIALLLTTGMTPGHPATGYVRRHGDGVAVVGLAVPDAGAAYRELVDRGAAPVSPPRSYADDGSRVVVAEVTGVGDVVHRLVERHGPDFLPGAVEALPPDPAAPAPVLAEVDHLAVCVPAGELARTTEFYQRVYGFDRIFSEYIEVAGQGMDSTVVQSRSGRVTLVLLEPDQRRRPGQIDDFLRWHHGAGVQHLGLRTDDILTAVDRLAAGGVRFNRTPDTYYDTVTERVGELHVPVARLRELGVLVDSDHAGQLLQIFTESVHVRRTLFLELIERRGALTFGSGNVTALYEAKERELAAAEPQPAGA